jgi:GT2 family glycosyltransferase
MIDLIIINYNSTEYTVSCIENVHKNIGSLNISIIVVDNNSNDKPDRIVAHFPDVKLIKNSKNIGFGKAVNLALKQTSSKYIILLNPDAKVIDNSFYSFFEYFIKHNEVGIAGPKIIDQDGSIQGSARRFPTIWTSIFGRKSPLTRLFPGNPITKREFFCFNGEKNKPQSVDWVSGACMMIRREAINQVGGFDKRFFMYWEDADLCKRLKENGWIIIYYPKAKVRHITGKSSDTRPLLSILNFHLSSYYYLVKHVGWPAKLVTPLALFGLGIRCIFVMGLNCFQRISLKLYSDRVEIDNLKTKEVIKKRKKILRIISRLNIGGPSIHCSILINGFNNDKYESKLISGSLSNSEGDMSYIINSKKEFLIRIPELQREINIRQDLKAFLAILRLLFKENPDLVHTHLAKAGALSRIAVWVYNVVTGNKTKTVHTYHGHVLEGYFSYSKSKIFIQIERNLARITDSIVAISHTQKWELTDKYQLTSARKVRIINLGFDLSRFINDESRGELRDRIGAEERDFLIGIVGRLVPIKNHRLFLDAAFLVKKRFPMKLIKFIIIGDGELRKDLQEYSKKIGLDESVIFYGWEKSIHKVYSDLDLLVLTSNNEGTPVSIIESMASSVPVVTTGVGGIKDLLGSIEGQPRDNENCSICERGILCPKGNAKAIADGIAYSIEHYDPIRITRARDFVYKKYSEQHLIKKVERLYHNLLD